MSFNAQVYTKGTGAASLAQFVPVQRSTNPFITDVQGTDGIFKIGQQWINTVSGDVFELTSLNTQGGALSAVWTLLSAGGGSLATLTGNSGGPVTPTAGNVSVVGSGDISVAGVGSTLTISSASSGAITTMTGDSGGAISALLGNLNLKGLGDLYNIVGSGNTLTITPTAGAFPVCTHVVGPVGEAGYQTIQSALDAIGPGGSGVIFLQPGVYTENLVFPNPINVTLRSNGDDNCGDAKIIGTHVPPLSGNVLFWMIGLKNVAGNIFTSSAAGSTNFLVAHNIQEVNGYIFDMPNWTGSWVFFATSDFASTADGVVNNPSGGGTMYSLESSMGVGNTFPWTLSGFSVIEVNNVNCPIETMGSAQVNFYDSNFFSPITLGGATTGFFVNSLLQTGSSTALTYNSSGATTLSNVTIDSTANPAIAGTSTGALQIGVVPLMNNSSVASTVNTPFTSTLLTGSARIQGSQTGKVTTVLIGASPYTVSATDFFINCTTSGGGITINLPSSPLAGRTVTVSDGSGNGASNNITVNGNGNNIALGGTSASSKTISSAFGVVNFTFNGTIWIGN